MLLVLTAMTKMDELHHGEAMFAKKVKLSIAILSNIA
jgi:hypothetical protein